MRQLLSVFGGLLLTSPSLNAETGVRLTRIASGLSVPIHVTHAPDGSGRLFICEQAGTVRVIVDGVLQEAPFLDISSKVVSGGEGGLLSIAFHPDFAENGRFFAFYQGRPSGIRSSVVEEFVVQDGAGLPDGRVLLTINNPIVRHLGGQMAFGPDGYLYIAVGDGGITPPDGNIGDLAQDLTSLRGKILRIDVEGDPYTIPPNNPFVGQQGVREEIWAYGLRNPWRFSFDRSSGRLMAGDVGANRWEEVNRIRRGANYGWNGFEGPDCFPPGNPICSPEETEAAVFAYPQTAAFGRSVTGGFFYRGHQPSGPFGRYIFADFITGRLWLLEESPGIWQERELLNNAFNVPTMGEDEAGELYLTDIVGTLYRLDFVTRRVLGQIVDGGKPLSARSRIEILNPASTEARAKVAFFDHEGDPLPIGPSQKSVVDLVIPPGGVAIVTTGEGNALRVGWARITSDEPVEANVGIQLSQTGQPEAFADAGFLAADSGKSHRLVIARDAARGQSTALSLVNPSETETATIRMTLRDAQQGIIAEAVEVLDPRHHVARFVEEWFETEDLFESTLAIEANHDVAVTAIRTRNGVLLFGLPASRVVREGNPPFEQ